MTSLPFESASLVEIEGLSKRYSPRVLALDNITLELQAGIVGLVGANGAGKSTLIKILLGLLDPTGGSAKLLGMDVRQRGAEIRQFVGYMPEHDCLPGDVSATDFVTHVAQISGIPRAAARERTAEVLRLVGLFEERYREMEGYSTGMKQRVKLAQALVHGPRLVFLDEPTNGLDPAGRDEMLDLVGRVGSEFGIAIVMSSHLLGEIERVCNHLVIIDGGRLVQHGSMDSFVSLTQSVEVEVDSQPEALAERLKGAGLQVRQQGRSLVIALDGTAPYEIVRDAVADMGLGLLRLEQGRHRLEDIFEAPPAELEEVGASGRAV